jgi:hypothetical protein
MTQTRMRTAPLRLVKILLSSSGHATQAAGEQGSDLVDYGFYITIKRPKRHDDQTGFISDHYVAAVGV